MRNPTWWHDDPAGICNCRNGPWFHFPYRGGTSCRVECPRSSCHQADTLSDFHGTPEAHNWQGSHESSGPSATEAVCPARNDLVQRQPGSSSPERGCRTNFIVTVDEQAPIVIQPASDRYEVALGEKIEIPFKIEKAMNLKGELVITVHGLPHSKPPSVKLKQDAVEGSLALAFSTSNEFKAAPGKWTFSLRGECTIKHRHNLCGEDRSGGGRSDQTSKRSGRGRSSSQGCDRTRQTGPP